MSRLAVFSDTVSSRLPADFGGLLTYPISSSCKRPAHLATRFPVDNKLSCKWWMTLGGFVEISSLAISDRRSPPPSYISGSCISTDDSSTVLLLYRLHALWGGRRSIVIATYALYFAVYSCITTVGLISAVQLVRKS